MATLYILMGAPGSGKSTFVKNHFIQNNDCHISRDEIRFALVKEDEEYFSREKEVFRNYINIINNSLEANHDVFADATHLNRASRNKLLRNIRVKPSITAIVWIKTPLNECLRRNENRAGTRAYVPPQQIKDMYNRIEKPEFDEGVDVIYIVEPDKEYVQEYRKKELV